MGNPTSEGDKGRESTGGMEASARVAVVLAGSYIAAQMLSDIGSLKITTIFGLAVDAGTFIYPITFTLRDLVHKRLGHRAARSAVLLAGLINVLMALYFQLIANLRPDPSWQLDEAFRSVLGPVWRIVLASIAAEVVSELLDGEVYQKWTQRYPGAPHWSRVLISNLFSLPVDSLVFCWGAFAFSLPAATVWSIFWANVLLKTGITLASLPTIYLVREGKPAPSKEDENRP